MTRILQKKSRIYPLFLFSSLNLMIFLGSCIGKKDSLFQIKRKTSKAPVSFLIKGSDSLYFSPEQIIKPGDVLSLRNLQNETQILGYTNGLSSVSTSSDYKIENDSTVVLPFLNAVKLGGLSIPEAEKFLNKAYSENLLKDPLIKIKITNLKVTLLGEFNKIGNLPLKNDRIHLTEILGDAGGITKRANPKNLRIIRGNLRNPTVMLIDLEDINSLKNDNLYLHNNDIIYAETKNSYKFLDQITSARTILGITVSIFSAYLLIDRLK